MKTIMPDMFSELITLLTISLTTDILTCRATASNLTITVHHLESFVAQIRQVTVSHTAENMSEELKLAIDECNLKKKLI